MLDFSINTMSTKQLFISAQTLVVVMTIYPTSLAHKTLQRPHQSKPPTLPYPQHLLPSMLTTFETSQDDKSSLKLFAPLKAVHNNGIRNHQTKSQQHNKSHNTEGKRHNGADGQKVWWKVLVLLVIAPLAELSEGFYQKLKVQVLLIANCPINRNANREENAKKYSTKLIINK
jgi:hypothetical protein